MKWRGIGQTHVGMKRTGNEDALLCDDDLGLYVVSDGMGGHASGEVASAEAIRAFTEVVRNAGELQLGREAATTLVRRALETACKSVYRLARSDSGKSGMGCTLTAALVRPGYAAIAHVGDSRCYLRRGDQVGQVTADHTVGAELARAGVMTAEEAQSGSFANVLARAVGTHEAVQVDAFAIDLLGGDALLLCSDGLSGYIPSDAWLAQHIDPSALDASVEELIAHANQSGGHDNSTAVLVTIEAEPDDERAHRRKAAIGGRMQALESVFLFEELSLGLLSRLLDHCEVQRFEPGAIIMEQASRCDSLLVITDGRAALSRDGGADEEIGAGQHVGITALLRPRPARATLRAIAPTSLLVLSGARFWQLLKARPWLGVNLLERLTGELSRGLDELVMGCEDGAASAAPLSRPAEL